MIDLKGSVFTDITPENLSSQLEVQAFAYAVGRQVEKLCLCADQMRIYAAVDDMPERILDIVAVELRTPVYNENFSIEVKRALIKGTMKFYAHMGTPSACNQLIETVFGYGYIEEWFDYGGEPHHFRIYLGQNGENVPLETMEEFQRNIGGVKRLSSWLDGIVYMVRFTIEVSFRLEPWAYAMPPCNTLYCGTFPYFATVGWTEKPVIHCTVKLDMVKHLSRLCGTYPDRAVVGWLTKAEIQTHAKIDLPQSIGNPCGKSPCGTIPLYAVAGWTERGRIECGATLAAMDYLPRLCGSYPSIASIGWSMGAAIGAGHWIEFIKHIGKICGTAPDTATIGASVSGKTVVSVDIERKFMEPPVSGEKCGTVPRVSVIAQTIKAEITAEPRTSGVMAAPEICGETDCGTHPERTGLALVIGAGVDSSASVMPVTKAQARSGMTTCGATPAPVLAGGQVRAEIGVSDSAEGFKTTAQFEKAECGTVPLQTGQAIETKAPADLSCFTEGIQVSAPFCNTKYCGQY